MCCVLLLWFWIWKLLGKIFFFTFFFVFGSFYAIRGWYALIYLLQQSMLKCRDNPNPQQNARNYNHRFLIKNTLSNVVADEASVETIQNTVIAVHHFSIYTLENLPVASLSSTLKRLRRNIRYSSYFIRKLNP